MRLIEQGAQRGASDARGKATGALPRCTCCCIEEEDEDAGEGLSCCCIVTKLCRCRAILWLPAACEDPDLGVPWSEHRRLSGSNLTRMSMMNMRTQRAVGARTESSMAALPSSSARSIVGRSLIGASRKADTVRGVTIR